MIQVNNGVENIHYYYYHYSIFKQKLRNKCQWDALGFPSYWPENRDQALLDRAEEIYGLGIASDTTSEEEDMDTTT